MILEAETFGDFLSKYLETLENGGRGELRRISVATGIHSTTLSQAVNGIRPFSPEQVASICQYLGLNNFETKYAFLLLQLERAGTKVLREFLSEELKAMKLQALELVNVVPRDKVLSESEKALFYSNWYYSAIAVFSSIPNFQTASSLSSRTGLSVQKTNQILEFLVGAGICIDKKGKIEPGTNSTHLEAKSPLASRHHGNWRIKAMERHPDLDSENELAYSSPMSISKEDAKKIRTLVVNLVKKVGEIRDPSPCEEAYLLNVDWIKI